MEGIARSYYESGKLEAEYIYKNGKMEGYFNLYSENERVVAKVLYRNDKAVSGTCDDGRAFTSAELITCIPVTHNQQNS
jgi:hypothetical protein